VSTQPDISKLAADASALVVHCGARFIAAKNLCDQGVNANHPDLASLDREANQFASTLDGLYYTAKLLLSAGDFQQFVDRSGIGLDPIQEGIDRVTKSTTTPPLWPRTSKN
jgi:hypothetical protein